MEALTSLVIEEALGPILRDLARQTGRSIRVVVSARDASGRTHAQDALIGEAPYVDGEARVEFRAPFNDRVAFQAEAILSDLSEGTGFSGVRLSGVVEMRTSPMSAALSGHTFKYNSTWSRQFADWPRST